MFPNPLQEVSELQIFVNICPNICPVYEVMYLHLQYTLSLLTSRDLTLPFYGTFVTINILQKNWCFLSKTFVCTGCPKKWLSFCVIMWWVCAACSFCYRVFPQNGGIYLVYTWLERIYRMYGIFEIIWNIQNTCMIVKERLWTGGVYLAGAVIRL